MAGNDNTGHEHQLVFTSSQAARYLGVSLATIRRWTNAGYLTGYRTPGGQRRFSRDQLDGFVASLQRTSEPAPQQLGIDEQTASRTSAPSPQLRRNVG